MKMLKTITLIPLLGLLAMPALADRAHGHADGDRQHRYDYRQERQHDRIRHGIRSGELTRKEAKSLRKQQRHIARLERRFERDGHLNRYERRTLRRELDSASQRIYRLKHNDRYRDRRHTGHHRRDDHKGRYHGYRSHDGYRGLGDSGWSIALVLWDQL